MKKLKILTKYKNKDFILKKRIKYIPLFCDSKKNNNL